MWRLIVVCLVVCGRAHGADDLFYRGDVGQALQVLQRDADVAASAVRAMPLLLGDDVRVIGWPHAACDRPLPGEQFSRSLRQAELDAVDGLRDLAAQAVRDLHDRVGCVDVPVRRGEWVRLHDLASALASLAGEDAAAVAFATTALAAADGPLEHQASSTVLDHARADLAARSTWHLRLPPGLAPYRVMVDGQPVSSMAVPLSAGVHVVQVLAEDRVVTRRVEVADRDGALVVPEGMMGDLRLDDAEARAWAAAALGRWGPVSDPVWFVVQRQVWSRTGEAHWVRFERRPPRAQRPALLALSAAGVVSGSVVAGVFGAQWDGLGRCGRPEAVAAVCAPFADPQTGLLFDPEGIGSARQVPGGLAIGGGVLAVGSAVALAFVAHRARGPRAVPVAVLPQPTRDGLGIAVAGGLP